MADYSGGLQGGMNAAVAVKESSLMETSGSLSAQANDLLNALQHVEDHLSGGKPHDVSGKLAGGPQPTPVLAAQLRDTSYVLRQAFETVQRIKNGIGI
jgi:hypothetical protein